MAKAQNDKVSTVQIYPDTRRIVDRISETTGVAKTEILSRMLAWFDGQSPAVQNAMLDARGDVAAELAREYLSRGGVELPADVMRSCMLIRELATKVETAFTDLQTAAGKKLPGARQK